MRKANANESLHKLLSVVRDIERERNSRIWCLIHKAGAAHICFPTMWSIYSKRRETGTGEKIELLLHSSGGHPDIAYQTMKFFRRRFQQVDVIVPLLAQSAATLMCLGADTIHMGELATLGPVDIQIDDDVKHGGKSFSPLDEFKSLEYIREQAVEWMDWYASVMNGQYGMSIKEALKDAVPLVTGLMQPILAQIDPIETGTNRRALAIGEEYAKRILAYSPNAENKEDLARHIVWDYPSHDFDIDFEEAKHILKLPVERLPESQDQRLSEAILDFDGDAYHGFALPIQPQSQPRRSARTKRRAAQPQPESVPPHAPVPEQRIEGGNGLSSQERVTS